ncbi:metal-dependent hydrolase, putative [Psychroflexus gondwanensis ACAM 44]|jgi:rRNA maturation RNase YbeY|uniref:Endoribonuclease YbeY n=1 Tax=Psychroflexus gondwanensis ACAM 44 TaxID=1189619 RepID=N1WZU0_9FLAO|nr:rRNA maturation RNase YbeY [Psychroflexus gondwanensis]EMY82697.1 metal-dependent hydrolase, putative [Psychroflexus gondwanensis ACAM 44]
MADLINFYSTTDFDISNQEEYRLWLLSVIKSEQKTLGELTYVFCSDEYLLDINQSYLQHDTLTDIITFDYTEGDSISAEIYISIDRVKENAKEFSVDFEKELKRVMAHGVLHCCGYKDSTEEEKDLMRAKENLKIELFHVEQK